VLAGSGIDAARLQDAGYFVDLEQCQSVVANMIRLSGDPGLGLSFGSTLRMADLGIVGHALLSSRSVRQALTLWLQYSRALLDTLVHVHIDEEDEGRWTMRMSPATPCSSAVYRFCVQEFLVIGLQLGRVLSGKPMRLTGLQLAFAPDGLEAQYRQLSGCDPLYGADTSAIRVAGPLLDQTLNHDPDELGEICLRHCSKVMRHVAQANPTLSRLRSLLLRNTGNPPAITEAARSLGISERTLRRRLATEGTCYQDLLADFRRDLAVEYLRSARMRPKEVGYLLGFRSPNTFRRAFKGWTGKTVGEFLNVNSG